MTKEVTELNSACQQVFDTLTPKPYVYIGMDQRSTKSLGNYEAFVFGFSLTVPVPLDGTDDISKAETQEKWRKKYESISSFLNSLMSEVESHVNAAQNLVPVTQVLNDSKITPGTTTSAPVPVTPT